MSTSVDKRQYLKPIASDTIGTFEAIFEVVTDKMRRTTGSSRTSIANAQTFTGGTAHSQLDGILRSEQESLGQLAREPAISRIVAIDAEGDYRTYYICRNSPVHLPGRRASLASYKSKVGRLASLPIGEEVEVEIDGARQTLELVERSRLQPILHGKRWDSQNTIVEGERVGIVTVESLRALLDDGADKDLVAAILAEEQGAAEIREGIRRGVIRKMGLRDQPILDQFQDNIFRSPLDSRLLILGPPGAGKTTTLIRRLGQKLDIDYLDEAEAGFVRRVQDPSLPEHSQSWFMFSPTDLLKQYVKEAFALEQIPASERHMRTWADHRRYLARNVFGVLRSSSGRGYFVLREDLSALKTRTVQSLTDWHDDFARFHAHRALEQLHHGLETLQHRTNDRTERIAGRVAGLLEGGTAPALPGLFGQLELLHGDIAPVLKELKAESDLRIREALNLRLNADRSFLHEFAEFLDSLDSDDMDDGEDDVFDDDDDTADTSPRTPVSKAMAAYLRFIKALSRTRVQKRRFGKGSRNARILKWLGERIPSDEELTAVGRNVRLQNCLRRFMNTPKRFVHDVGRSYRAFRRQRLREDHWYTAGVRDMRAVSPLEIDLILLVMLRNARALLNERNIAARIDEPRFGYLREILGEYRNQVVVDEATDFSCIQLACMAHLTHPSLESFFACGDFNQRITEWGCRSLAQFAWAVPDIETRSINVSYRQSRQLNEFSNKLIAEVSGGIADVTLPQAMENEGVAPALLENANERDELCRWLAGRFTEIEEFVEQLPSIAVLVRREADVQPLADALDGVLVDQNIRVTACINGQNVGQDTDVRVFAVEHIKGLEFEAVFFVAVDQLAQEQPDLFDKYLYVGATRAATYLGITCEGALPRSLERLRGSFVPSWGNGHVVDDCGVSGG